MNLSEQGENSGVFHFLPIEDVHYGPGCLSGLGQSLAQHQVKRALLIASKTLNRETSLVSALKTAAGGRVAEVFDGTTQHVHRQSVLAAIEAARAIDADAIISFGGGSPNDTGKAVVMGLAENVRTLADFDRLRVRFTYPDKIELPPLNSETLPMFAVSTTLSGGEFTHFAGITDSERQVKDLYIGQSLAARAVFLDAELSLATPQWLWLSSGMRSVDHCIEALCSVNAHPFTDALAARALSMLNHALRETFSQPEAIAPRSLAQQAAWMSVCGLANVNLGLSHGIGHQLGARNDVPHGVTSCVMMAPTMRFNRDHVLQRHGEIAQLLGVDTAGLDAQAAAEAAADAVAKLVSDLALPSRLRDVGVAEADFPALAADAMEDMIVASNPRPVTSVEDVIEVLRSAY